MPIRAEDHYYTVTLPDGSTEQVYSTGWVNTNGDLSLQDPTGKEVRRFPAGTWKDVQAMPAPEGETP
jgi:hypothetical protein